MLFVLKSKYSFKLEKTGGIIVKNKIFYVITHELFLVVCLVFSLLGLTLSVDASQSVEAEVAQIEMPVNEVKAVEVVEVEKETLKASTVLQQVQVATTQPEYKEVEKTLLNADVAVPAKITTYGTDCSGCVNSNGYGYTASGISLSFDGVQQSNGVWQDGITFNGYYIVATGGSIPFGTIIEVSNHGFSGKGLTPGVPFQAIVLDRGAMTLNHLDLFVGSQVSSGISIDYSKQPMMKLIRYGY